MGRLHRAGYPSTMESAVAVIVTVLVAGVGTMAILMWRAPAGYQDEEGFHFGSDERADRRQLLDPR